MKILSILASPAPGGAEMLVRNLCAEFTGRGHACHILFMSDAAGVGNPAGFERDFLAGLEAEGTSFDVMGPKEFRNVLAGARRLRRVVAEFRPDILHSHLARGLMCRSLSGVRTPTVYTHHNVTTNFSPLLFRLFDRSVQRYVAIGSACRDLLERHVRRPIVSIPNGVPASFSPAGRRAELASDPFILAVGNLSPKKDYGNLVQAAASLIPRLSAQGRSARFAIAGEGGERGRIERLVEEHGLGGHFHLLGARSDVAALMQEADALVNSSAHEGLPITLIEAAMSGLPAVATDVGGNAEVVLDGVSGYVVPPASPGALADALFNLLSDAGRHAAFSTAAREHSRQFTMAACADAHLELYRSLLGGASGSAEHQSEI
ncbi:MAG TPA: glycosyltransferase [Allosphingosinicella sp.]|nr:glycosyltransferase [Allosphingosinicella sp.]